jgi:hypothetical protein
MWTPPRPVPGNGAAGGLGREWKPPLSRPARREQPRPRHRRSVRFAAHTEELAGLPGSGAPNPPDFPISPNPPPALSGPPRPRSLDLGERCTPSRPDTSEPADSNRDSQVKLLAPNITWLGGAYVRSKGTFWRLSRTKWHEILSMPRSYIVDTTHLILQEHPICPKGRRNPNAGDSSNATHEDVSTPHRPNQGLARCATRELASPRACSSGSLAGTTALIRHRFNREGVAD